jgi:hypothetical protein
MACLIAEHGPDLPIPALPRIAAADCSRMQVERMHDVCGGISRAWCGAALGWRASIPPTGAQIQCPESGLSTHKDGSKFYPSKPDISPDRRWRNPMKKMVLAVIVGLAVTAGIASAGIASLASGAAVLINATSHSGPHDSIAYSTSRSAAGI